MRFLHIADLHIGKKLNGFSLIEDQRYILEQILAIAEGNNIDAVLIAGDIYDQRVPPVEAVVLLDWFLQGLVKGGRQVFVIPGNHDSAERFSFASNLLKEKGLHIAGVFDGNVDKTRLADSYGNINIYMLPFMKAAQQEDILANIKVNSLERNILLFHGFITGKDSEQIQSDSEYKSVGSLENIDYSLFKGFDYTALGHLHCPQRVVLDSIRYAGSPLKYSVSEKFQPKQALIVDIKEKGNIDITAIAYAPLRDLRQIKGELALLLAQEETEDYISIVLTDKNRHFDPMKRIRRIYKNCISIEYENEIQSISEKNSADFADLSAMSGAEIFQDFYEKQNGEKPGKEAIDYINKIFDKAGMPL